MVSPKCAHSRLHISSFVMGCYRGLGLHVGAEMKP